MISAQDGHFLVAASIEEAFVTGLTTGAPQFVQNIASEGIVVPQPLHWPVPSGCTGDGKDAMTEAATEDASLALQSCVRWDAVKISIIIQMAPMRNGNNNHWITPSPDCPR